MLKELMHEISEFIAEVSNNWYMETRIRHLLEKGVKTQPFKRQKYFRYVRMKRVGGGEYHRPLRPKVWEVIGLFVLW
jgi:hypothetical protein